MSSACGRRSAQAGSTGGGRQSASLTLSCPILALVPETPDPQTPRVFIGSSTEGLAVAKALQVLLAHNCEVEIWDQGVFEPGGSTLSSLIGAARRFDAAIFVVSPDDTTASRGLTRSTPRDNVIFELGLFMGTVGPERCFMVYEEKTRPGLPSDLAGVTAATFRMHSSLNVRASVGAATTKVEEAILRNGLLPTALVTRVQAEEAEEVRAARNADAGDDADRAVTPDDAVDELVKRWVNYKPKNEASIRAVVDGLRRMGYELALSEPRTSGAGSRTYLRALRRDGMNAGYMNSTRFSLVGAASLVEDDAEPQPAYIAWAEADSVQTVLEAARQFLRP